MEILGGVGPVLWLGNAELGEDETVELIVWLALIINALVGIHNIPVEVLERLLLDGSVGVVPRYASIMAGRCLISAVQTLRV